MVEVDRLQRAYDVARGDLIAAGASAGHWVGELSSSPLATATAVSALSLVQRHAAQHPGTYSDQQLEAWGRLICRGLRWLADAQNSDGGWGDTDRSRSSLAATMLVRAAFSLTAVPAGHANLLDRATAFLDQAGGVAALKKQYARDKAFLVPVLTQYALAGLVGWNEVPALSYELSLVPPRWRERLPAHLVRRALPSLIATGQARFFHRRPLNPGKHLVRKLVRKPTLELLERLQPESGGYCEAVPQTSFVVMSLAAMDQMDHPVVRRGVEFLQSLARADGSWPLGACEATRVTTVALDALAAAGENVAQLDCLPWLLAAQQRRRQFWFTATPGGWGANELSGALPNALDTSGALLALAQWVESDPEADTPALREAALTGLPWLLDLQGREGGWPTLDRAAERSADEGSGTDVTAQVIRALAAWRRQLTQPAGEDLATLPFPTITAEESAAVELEKLPGQVTLITRISGAILRGIDFLESQQRPDGSWAPLWLGNQFQPDDESPVLGTARVLTAYRDLGLLETPAAQRGLAWLVAHQNRDGGWGGRGSAGSKSRKRERVSSVEETAMAVEALGTSSEADAVSAAVESGQRWLIEAVDEGRHREAAPVSFSFDRLWYYDGLYPLALTVSALGSSLCGTRRAASAPQVALPANS